MTFEKGTEVGQLPQFKEIRAPHGGWVPWGIYLVKVSQRASNPIYTALMCSGFLNGRDPNLNRSRIQAHEPEMPPPHHRTEWPGGYSTLWSPGSHDAQDYERVFFLEPIALLAVRDESFEFVPK